MQVLTKCRTTDDATMPNGGDWNVVSGVELKKMQKMKMVLIHVWLKLKDFFENAKVSCKSDE